MNLEKTMRALTLVVVSLLFPLVASADTYVFNFGTTIDSVTYSAAIPNGSFTYDGTQFTSFDVQLGYWPVKLPDLEQALSFFDLTDTQYFNHLMSNNYFFYAEGTFNFGREALEFDGPCLLTFSCTDETPNIAFPVGTDGWDNGVLGDEGMGTYTITDTTAVPEPGTMALLGCGIALLCATRRRWTSNTMTACARRS